ncbi:MAG: Ig-like domain-containing protein [Parcubacteria group bacterium]
MEAKKIHFSYTLKQTFATLIGVVVCVYAISSVVSGASFHVFAQVNPSGDQVTIPGSGTVSIVYLISPDTSSVQPPVLQGQSEFHIRFVPDGVIASVGITYLQQGNIAADGHCETISHDTTGVWRLRCETMHIPNDSYSVNVFAKDTAGLPLQLSNSAGLAPVFGPIYIHNTYQLSFSGDQQKASSVVTITATLPGEAAEVHIRESGPVTVSQAATRVQSSPSLSVWTSTWDTTSVPDGNYEIRLNIKTRPGVFLESVYTRWIEVSNAPLCTTLWECGEWSVCVGGIQTRNCVDIHGCNTDVGMPETSQSCTTPPQSDEPSTNTNSLTNLPTNSSGDEPVSPPIIGIISPSPGVTVQGTVELVAKVTGSNITSAAFYFNGTRNNILIGAGTREGDLWKTRWDTNKIENGTYEVIARVKVLSDNIYASSPVQIHVSNTQTPTTPVEYPSAPPDDDGDGLPNTLEEQYGVNPNTPDSDGDGRPDVDEILQGENPSGSGSLEEGIGAQDAEEFNTFVKALPVDSPITSGSTSEDLQVTTVFNSTVVDSGSRIVISGVGPPNSIITIFIYSSPIVVVTKTDANGNFSFVLDKEISDGEHEVYATITDDTGKIVTKSSPLSFFVREARAVNEEEYLRGYTDVESASSELVREYIIIAILLVLGGFFIYVLVRLVRMKRA